jgi:hypothetical protein
MSKVEEIVDKHFNNTLINCPWVLQDGTITVLPEVVKASKELYSKELETLISEERKEAIEGFAKLAFNREPYTRSDYVELVNEFILSLEGKNESFDKMFEGTTPKDLDKILPTKEEE